MCTYFMDGPLLTTQFPAHGLGFLWNMIARHLPKLPDDGLEQLHILLIENLSLQPLHHAPINLHMKLGAIQKLRNGLGGEGPKDLLCLLF